LGGLASSVGAAEFAKSRAADDENSKISRVRRAAALGLDYRRIGAEHVLIGPVATFAAKAQQ